MKKRITVLAAIVAATMAIGAVPAFAAGTDATDAPRPHRAERVQPERSYPPEWIGQSADEIRAQLTERADKAKERIAANDRMTDEQKAAAVEQLEGTLAAVADLDEPEAVIGTAVSRRQLERIERRANRDGVTPDYDVHITRDIENFSRRLAELTKIAGWAETAGEDVTVVTGYLDNASALLEVAGGSGTVEERHDAAHIARAWLTEANVTLMAM